MAKRDNGSLETAKPYDRRLQVLAPVGRLGFMEAPALQRSIRQHIYGGVTVLLVDLARVDFVSVSTMRMFLGLSRLAASRRSQIALIGAPPPIRALFRVAGIDREIPIADDVEEGRRVSLAMIEARHEQRQRRRRRLARVAAVVAALVVMALAAWLR